MPLSCPIKILAIGKRGSSSHRTATATTTYLIINWSWTRSSRSQLISVWTTAAKRRSKWGGVLSVTPELPDGWVGIWPSCSRVLAKLNDQPCDGHALLPACLWRQPKTALTNWPIANGKLRNSKPKVPLWFISFSFFLFICRLRIRPGVKASNDLL